MGSIDTRCFFVHTYIPFLLLILFYYVSTFNNILLTIGNGETWSRDCLIMQKLQQLFTGYLLVFLCLHHYSILTFCCFVYHAGWLDLLLCTGYYCFVLLSHWTTVYTLYTLMAHSVCTKKTFVHSEAPERKLTKSV